MNDAIAATGEKVEDNEARVAAAFAKLDAMVGLESVKQEVKLLAARLEVEQRRRDQGLPTAAVNLHMVFTGPAGAGKSKVAEVIGELFCALNVLRKGFVSDTDPSGLVAQYIGQSAQKTLDKCKEALDGILFIDEAYKLEQSSDHYKQFDKEAIDMLLKFMDEHRERLMVIIAGYPKEMQRFLDATPELSSRFVNRINFPSYGVDDLCEMFRRMATRQKFTLPGDFADTLTPWIEQRSKLPDWANGREMRTLLEKVREAQLIRMSPDDDLSRFTTEDLVMATSCE
jgi:stage V sporulation protein K